MFRMRLISSQKIQWFPMIIFLRWILYIFRIPNIVNIVSFTLYTIPCISYCSCSAFHRSGDLPNVVSGNFFALIPSSVCTTAMPLKRNIYLPQNMVVHVQGVRQRKTSLHFYKSIQYESQAKRSVHIKRLK